MRSARLTVRAAANRLHRQKRSCRTADDRVDFAQLIDDHEQQIEQLCREHFSALRTLLREHRGSARRADAKEYQNYLSANCDFVRQTMDEGASVLRQALSGDGQRQRALRRRFSRFRVLMCIRRWFGSVPQEPGEVLSSPMDTQHFLSRRFKSPALEHMYREYHLTAFKSRLRIATVIIMTLTALCTVFKSIGRGADLLIFSARLHEDAPSYQEEIAVPLVVVFFSVLMFSDRLLTPRYAQKLVVLGCLSLVSAYSLPSIFGSNIMLRSPENARNTPQNVTLSANVENWSRTKLLYIGTLEIAGAHSRLLECQPRVPRARPSPPKLCPHPAPRHVPRPPPPPSLPLGAPPSHPPTPTPPSHTHTTHTHPTPLPPLP